MPEPSYKEPRPLAAKALVAGGIVAAALVAFGVVPLFFGAGCDFSGMDETVIRQITAPDGKHTAVIVERGGDGGATVGYFRVVALCDGSGGCAAKKETIVASGRAQGISNLGWLANDKLVIYHGASEMVTGDGQRNGVQIEYVPIGQ